jgi:hypothetical protein
MPALSLAMVAALAGCATSQPVTQIDKDTYLLVASSRWHGNDGVATRDCSRPMTGAVSRDAVRASSAASVRRA